MREPKIQIEKPVSFITLAAIQGVDGFSVACVIVSTFLIRSHTDSLGSQEYKQLAGLLNHPTAHSPLYPFLPLKQDKRKHRGPSTKITPKSREFIETDSSSSSSECHSDSEEALKIPALPPQAISTPPLPPCLGPAGSLGTFGGKGLRLKEAGAVTTNGSSSSSIAGSANGGSCNTLSIGTITGSFGTSVPDPGGSGGQRKDPASVSPPLKVGHEVPRSPLKEYQELQGLWVKIELGLLSRVPGPGTGEGSRAGLAEKDRGEGRDRERQGERTAAAERERQKQAEREWPGLRERPKPKEGEDTERLVQDRERQADRDRLPEREKPTDREDRDQLGPGERERTTGRDREKVLDNPLVQEQSNPRLAGRTESKHRKQAAGNTAPQSEKHANKSKRKHKVSCRRIHNALLSQSVSFFLCEK